MDIAGRLYAAVTHRYTQLRLLPLVALRRLYARTGTHPVMVIVAVVGAVVGMLAGSGSAYAVARYYRKRADRNSNVKYAVRSSRESRKPRK